MIYLLNKDYIEPSNRLFCLAKLLLKENGIKQWQGEYPNSMDAQKDILNKQAYGLIKHNKLVGYMALIYGIERNYVCIHGSWQSDLPYFTIHRLCVDPLYKGCHYGQTLIDFAIRTAKTRCCNLRCDTHFDNHCMQHLLEKNGFIYCGVIQVEDGTDRKAYELVLE